MSGFTFDPQAFSKIMTSERMKAEMVRRAEKVKTEAEATAPVGETGDYKKSFEVSSGVYAMGDDVPNERAYARVTNDAPYAVHVEYGDGRTPEHRTLGKALKAAG